MSANLVQIPISISGFGATIRYKTDVIVGRNGQEVRNALWQDPLMAYDASFPASTLAAVHDLQAFFHNLKGAEQSFLVKDLSDYQIVRTNIGTGNGVITTFQLIKNYTTSGIGTYSRTIAKPKDLEGVGGVRVWVNNVELLTSAFSFSPSTGIITIPSAPANTHAVEASCDEFYVPVRFESDELPVNITEFWTTEGIVDIPNQKLLEVRGE